MSNIVNGLGQIKVGVKLGTPPPTLIDGIFAVYNADNNMNDALGRYNGISFGGISYGTTPG